jgi:transcriptional regulator with XRE-family HTH domain
VDLAAKARVSASAISRIERGRIDQLTVDKLRCVSEALDASLDIRLRWNGEGLDRLLDQAHAELVESLVRLLRAAGWEVEVESSFALGGERGSIDVFAYHSGRRMVLVVEVKSVVPDSQATMYGLDRKSRLAPQIARAKGWDCRGVARLLVIGDSSTSRRRIGQLSSTYGTAFPMVGRSAARWIRDPDGPISGLLFLPYSRRVTAGKPTTGVQRVRRSRQRPGQDQTVTG